MSGRYCTASIAGCDEVFQCAYDLSAPENNTKAAKNVADACLRNRARRMVHVSTMAVYDPLADGDLTEESPAEPCGWAYKDDKLTIEHDTSQFVRERGLPATILQPTIVYGPFGSGWTVMPIQKLLRGTVVLPDDGRGSCNAVYVDDVVDALVLAAGREEAVGERFLISGAEPTTWHAFYDALQRSLGVESMKFMPTADIEQAVSNSEAAERRQVLRRLFRFGFNLLGDRHKAIVRQAYRSRWKRKSKTFLPVGEELLLYRSRACVRIDKARRLLGYDPAFGFDDGMALTDQYIRWAYPNQPNARPPA